MPSLGVNIAILDDQDRLVLTRREDFDVWCLPGGGVEAGETLTQAARREAQEETGLEVALTRLVGVYSRPGESRFSGHIFVFAARPVGGRLTPQSGETTEVRFFDRADLPDDLVQLAPRRIQHLYQGAGGSAVWAFHQDWPFSPGITRSDLYRLRDESGLSRRQFYRQYMHRTVPPGAVLELPAAGADTSPSALPTHLLDPDGSSPAIAITVAIILQGKLLLTRREDFDVWCLPGGSLDDGESLAEAARREAEEETDVQVGLTRLVGVYTRLSQNGCGIHLVVFAARPVGGRPRPQPGEVLEIGEFGPHDLPADLFLAHREMALDALAGVGGSRAWTQNVPWPFPPEMKRSQIYALRDASGLSPAAFYRQHFRPVQPDDEVDELGVEPC